MLYQPPGSPWCGPTAIANALRALGKKLPLEPIVKLCGTTPNGTDAPQMKHALWTLGYQYEECGVSDDRLARGWLISHVSLGHPVILCVDNWEHYVCVVGQIGQRYLLCDSENDPKNTAENGIHALTIRTICRRWKAAKNVSDGYERHYGLAVIPTKRQK